MPHNFVEQLIVAFQAQVIYREKLLNRRSVVVIDSRYRDRCTEGLADRSGEGVIGSDVKAGNGINIRYFCEQQEEWKEPVPHSTQHALINFTGHYQVQSCKVKLLFIKHFVLFRAASAKASLKPVMVSS